MLKSLLFTFLICIPITLGASSNMFDSDLLDKVRKSIKKPTLESSLDYENSLILGLIEGITEFLPISSTGHLILANHFLGLDRSIPLYDQYGVAIFDQKGNPFTLKQATNAYIIIIQGGAILAVLFTYWSRIMQIFWGCLGRNKEGFLIARNLVIAFIPAVIAGLLLEEIVQHYLFDPAVVILALVAGSLLMMLVQKWYFSKQKKKFRNTEKSDENTEQKLDLHELSCVKALLIGLLQCFAICPGVSRSMMTLVGGFLVGFRPRLAAEFSFLLGFITLSAATVYKIITDGSNLVKGIQIYPVLFGCLVAAISGIMAMRFLISIIAQHGFTFFAWYRIGLALVTFVALYVI